MKRIFFFLFVAGALSSCAPRTHVDKTRELLTDYFDSLALDLKIASLQVVDTIYTEMPADDSTYAAMMDELKSIEDQQDRFMRENKNPFSDPKMDEFWEQERIVEDRAKEYKYSYEGDLVGYAYEIIVKSDNLDLKKEAESKWFIINPEGTKITIKDANFQEIERLEAETAEINRLLKQVRGY